MSLYSECRQEFPELLGYLENSRRHGRFAHSFLLCSESEATRKKFALAIATLAGCPRADQGDAPDGTCDFCRRIAAGTYPEFHAVYPVGKMYQIKVGDRGNPEPNTLRYFMEQFHLTTAGNNRHKIGIIYEADRMNDEAQNALLKTLEEPPPDTTLILSTGHPASLLPTTRSRCQIINLPGTAEITDFAGSTELFEVLAELCFFAANDPVRAEDAAASLIRISGALATAAAEKVTPNFAQALEEAASSGDNALVKRIETRCSDEASGEYMRDRRHFLATIDTFCSQVFLLSSGIALNQLPHPEFFAGVKALPQITPERGEAVRHEAEELKRTLQFNVSEELALRTFAMKLALA